MASTLSPAPPPVVEAPLHRSHRSVLARERYLLWTGLVNRVCRLLGYDRLSGRLRRALLTRYGWRIGPGTHIDCIGYVYGEVQIGAGTYINRDIHFEAEAPIIIGDRVGVGPGVMFLTVSHHLGPAEGRVGAFDVRAITIGDGAWIGARALVLPGVQIGAGAVVAAGAVVTSDVPPNTLVAGVPAQVKKHLDIHSSHPYEALRRRRR